MYDMLNESFVQIIVRLIKLTNPSLNNDLLSVLLFAKCRRIQSHSLNFMRIKQG